MLKAETKKLLKDQRVVDEINRHKWIESEKAGYDIGFEKAAQDWIGRYADDWESEFCKKKEKKAPKSMKRKNER